MLSLLHLSRIARRDPYNDRDDLTTSLFDDAHEKLAADEATLAAVATWLKQVQPDVVVTHWRLAPCCRYRF
jgi:hypothetical protein